MDRSGFTDPVKERIHKNALNVLKQWNDKSVPEEKRIIQLIMYADPLISILNETVEGGGSADGAGPADLGPRIRAVFKNMHLNKRNDYYVALLLFPNASQSAINKRFKALIRLYHPDLHSAGNADDLACAKKITEAYNGLKDPVRKEEYGRRLIHRAFTMTRGGHVRFQRRNIILRVIVPSATVFCIFFAGAFLLTGERKEAYVLENVLATRPHGDRASAGDLEQSAEGRPAYPLTTRESDTPIPPTTPERGMASDPKRPPARHGVISRPGSGLQTKSGVAARKASSSPAPVRAVTTPREVSKESLPGVVAHAGGPAGEQALGSVTETKGNKASQANDFTKDAAAFVQQYIRTYEEGDINRFLGFYSTSVIENNRLDYNAVRKAYTQNFENNRYRYDLRNMRYENKGEYLRISGIYTITKLKGSSLGPVRGNIAWTLRREDGGLKIVKVDYRRF